MRPRRAEISSRVSRSLRLRFQAKALTSFAGLELIRRYLRSIRLAERVWRHLGVEDLKGDYGNVSMVLLLLGLLVSGGRRLKPILYLKDDPLILRFAGLKRLPTPRTVARWVRRIHWPPSRMGFRGFNPHHRKVPSYYPVTAYEAQTGQIVRTKNRPGNIQDGKSSLVLLRELIGQIRRTLEGRHLLEFLMDGAFLRKDVIDSLAGQGAEYAIKIPFYTWVGLKDVI